MGGEELRLEEASYFLLGIELNEGDQMQKRISRLTKG